MSNIDLYYFEEELSYLREKAEYFSKVHPEVASALGIVNGSIEDPEIARLIESVCLLNSGIQKRLDDNYSEFTENILNVIYPDYLRPVPSYSILGVDVDDKAKTKGFIPKGTIFELKEEDVGHCYFKTVDDLVIYPLKISKLNTFVAPFDEVVQDIAPITKNLIELEFTTTDESISCLDLDLDFLNIALRSDSNFSLKIYDEICHNLVDIYVEVNGKLFRLGIDALSNKTFDLNAPLLPHSDNSFWGVNLLQEFFMFGDVFNQFNIDLSSVKHLLMGNSFKLKFFLKDIKVEVFRAVQKENFTLFYVPLINLYEQYADPIVLDGLKEQYPITITDSARALSLYKVLKVTDIFDAQKKIIPELYHDTFISTTSSKRWTVKYQKTQDNILGKIELIDLNHEDVLNGNHSLLIKTLVTDGLFPTKINYASASLSPMSTITVPGSVMLLRRPSLPIYPSLDKVTNWEILAHLSFNYQMIFGGKDSTNQFKTLLSLYNLKDSRKNQILIEAIKSVNQEQVVEPIRINGKCCYVNGSKITVILAHQESLDGVYSFAQFLDRYFASFVGYNSFVQLDVMIEGSDELYVSFPRRLGCKKI